MSRQNLKKEDPVSADRLRAIERSAGEMVATDEHEFIRQWAAKHDAEPATGEATKSGPATRDVRDGGAGIRFNFPAAGQFRPISWDEWLKHFKKHRLMFVYEEEQPGQPPSARYLLLTKEQVKQMQRR